MAAENCKCQIKNTEFDLPKTEVLTLPGQGQFAAEPERRICRRDRLRAIFSDRAAGLPAYGDFCPDRVGLPTGAVSRQHAAAKQTRSRFPATRDRSEAEGTNRTLPDA